MVGIDASTASRGVGGAPPLSAYGSRAREGVLRECTTPDADRWLVPVSIWRAPHGFDTSAVPEVRSHHVIALRLSGSQVERLSAPGRSVERCPARGFCTQPAGEELRFATRRAIRYAHLAVNDNVLRNVAVALGGDLADRTDLITLGRTMWEDAGVFEALERYVTLALATEPRPTRLEMDSRANLLLLDLLRRCVPSPSGRMRTLARGGLAPWQYRRVVDYMDEHLSKDVSLEELGALVALSPAYFCRAFHVTAGQPPHRWLMERRVRRAQGLMAARAMSLTEIALEVGYSGQGSFGAAFRRVTGMTPSEWRRLHAEDVKEDQP